MTVGCQLDQSTSTVRPQQPWAIRSVLDYRPRMLTLALDSTMYVAYDLETCRFYKAWKGGVNWDGIVYNDLKVIQPTSWGVEYASDAGADPGWWVAHPGKKIIPDVRYRGYRFNKGHIFLQYTLCTAEDTIEIQERPEYISTAEGLPGLERTFFVSGSSDAKVFIRTQSRTLELRRPQTTLTTEFSPSTVKIQKTTPESTEHKGRYWIERSDCLTCHQWTENTVGPGFLQIAARYSDKEEVVSSLVNRVKHGGSGNWGTAAMNSHPDLHDEDLTLMIRYILSLDRSDENQEENVIEPAGEVEEASNQPGFGAALAGVHPSFDLSTIEPPGLDLRVGGMAFFTDGRLLVTTWSPEGSVYILDGVETGDSSKVNAKLIAQGLMEPLGAEVVNGSIYVLQKHELTQLIDHDGDEVADEYKAICNGFGVTADFHEFAFGLLFRDQHFYANLSIPMRLMTNEKPLSDRGRTVRIALDGSLDYLNYGLRQPNGIGFGTEHEIFITDNQGQWLPANKLIHLRKGAFHGMRWGLADSLKDIAEVPPAVWLPQDEIANSPSEPTTINDGPYKGQMLFGDITHGGIKRVYLENINGEYQGVVFRFSQGLKAGVNRLRWGPDGGLYIGEAGMVGGWSWEGKRSGLQRLMYNGSVTFEILSVKSLNNGFAIEFTEPLAVNHGESAQDYLVQQWWYLPTASYGGPKMDLETLRIEKITLSEDRKSVHLELPELKSGRVVYFKLDNQITSALGKHLWSGEAWYTLNNISNLTL